jgi:hypothetical protein
MANRTARFPAGLSPAFNEFAWDNDKNLAGEFFLIFPPLCFISAISLKKI